MHAEMTTGCAVVTAPPEEFVPQELRGKPVLGLIALYAGDPEAGAAAVQPIRDLGPAVDAIGPMPYTAFQASLDPFAPYGGGRIYARGSTCPSSATVPSTNSWPTPPIWWRAATR